eukprot:COSAG06_NODE_3081_length_5886_cov_5.736997_2_plen_190_part_00
MASDSANDGYAAGADIGSVQAVEYNDVTKTVSVLLHEADGLSIEIAKDYVCTLEFAGESSINDLTLQEFCKTIQSVQKSATTKLAMPNPKHSVLQSTYDASEECSIVETSQPLLLSTWASQYAIGPSAMELHMTFSPSWRSDIMTSTDGAYGCPDGNGGVVSGLLPAAANHKAGQIYVDIDAIEFHVQQ